MLHPRPATEWLLSVPRLKCLVPEGARTFLEQERSRVAGLQPSKGSSVAAKSSGGAPPKWDWEGAYIQLGRIHILEDDNALSRDVLNKRLENWFMDTTGKCPSDSEIRKKVKRFHETIWPPKL